MMNAPQWARLLPTTALFPRNPNIDLIEKRGLLEMDDYELPAPEYEEESRPDILGPYRVSDDAKIDFRIKHRKQYERAAANLAQKGLDPVRAEFERIEEEIEAISWLRDQCLKAEDKKDHQLQHRPTYSDDAEESLKEYLSALNSLRAEIARVRVHLRLRRKIFEKAVSHLRKGRSAEALRPQRPPYSEPVNTYLRLAYIWYLKGNRCSGDAPSELWKYLAEKTGKSKDAPREALKRQGFYAPNEVSTDPKDDESLTEQTRKNIIEEASNYF